MGPYILMDHLCGDRVKKIGVEISHRPTYVNPIYCNHADFLLTLRLGTACLKMFK